MKSDLNLIVFISFFDEVLKKACLKGKDEIKIKIMPYFFLLFFFLSPPAFSKIYINIGAPGQVKKSLIARAPFQWQGESPLNSKMKAVKGRMEQRLDSNLNFSSYFKLLDKEAFLEDLSKKEPHPSSLSPNGFDWDSWKSISADFLLIPQYYLNEKGQLVLEVYFYNVNSRKSVFVKRYTSSLEGAESLMDKLSNHIVKSLSGRDGIFKTKIVAVKSFPGKTKELVVMDWQGKKEKRLSYHESIVMSPVWLKKGDQVIYSAFVYNKRLKKPTTALFRYTFKTNRLELLSIKAEENFGSDVFPNGKKLLVSTNLGDGLMDIFEFNLKKKTFKALTEGLRGVISVEPSIHEKTGEIAFSSDRGGKTMIYVMDRNGKNIRQVSFAGHHNSKPDWHPFKKEIVFSGLSKGKMDLFLISSEGKNLKRLTSLKKRGRRANSESPSFSPDGRYVVFSSDLNGKHDLFIMNLGDLSVYKITSGSANYTSPKWSPYL